MVLIGGTISDDELSLWETCYSIIHQNLTIAVEIHLGLTIEQERQLFHDLNRLGKKVDMNLALDFDKSNPINVFTNEFLIKQLSLKITDKGGRKWSDDPGGLTRKEIAAINSRVFLNKQNVNSATIDIVNKRRHIAELFWQSVAQIPDLWSPLAKQNTIAAQLIILKALAKLTFDFAFSTHCRENRDDMLETLFAGIDQTGEKKIDFSHSNPVWRYYDLTDEERNHYGLSSLAEYLPMGGTDNRSLGSYEIPYFRFNILHSRALPVLCDMIRWQIGLPSRHKSV